MTDKITRDLWYRMENGLGATKKESNPKEACGIRKIPLSTVPQAVLAEAALGLLEGGRKYGRHNYRDTKVRASTYFDATWRHISAFWEGEDIDPDSGIPHISKAVASLMVLRDAQITDNYVDDRPPKLPDDWQRNMQDIIEGIFERHPESVPAYTEKDKKLDKS